MSHPRNKASQGTSDFEESGFFVMRTPLLPIDELIRWGDSLGASLALQTTQSEWEKVVEQDRKRLVERLRSLVRRPRIREALLLASPALVKAMDAWVEGELEEEVAEKVQRSLVRYLSRMTTRATPFGLFAGCSTGKIGETTRLVLAPSSQARRRSRLDMNYLSLLVAAVEREPSVRATLHFRPNSTLYRASDRLRYAESRVEGKGRSHHLVALGITDYLERTIACAASGAPIAELARDLVRHCEGVSFDEAEEFVHELIDNQVLRSDLEPAVTGDNPVRGVIRALRRVPEMTEVADSLESVASHLEQLDSVAMGEDGEDYADIWRALEKLSIPVDPARTVQVDMVKKTEEAILGRQVIDELKRGAQMLHLLAPLPSQETSLAQFRSAFVTRYDTREVPLAEVLDEEIGLGFQRSAGPAASASPLLEGLRFPGPSQIPSVTAGAREHLLATKLHEALQSRSQEIELDAQELEPLAKEERPPLPDAMAITATLFATSTSAVDRGEFRVLIRNVSGPSGALLLGRFCHLEESLDQGVRDHLRAEESIRPDAVFAEVVHLPEGRLGNVLLRPVLRSHEIPLLGRSGAGDDQQIPLSDLMVSVREGRVVLRSRALGKEVIPRLTSAHNYSGPNIGIYRFLCSLQSQGTTSVPGLNWGPFELLPFLPRVSVGRAMLSRARWLVPKEEHGGLRHPKRFVQFQRVQEWRKQRRLPRFVALVEMDHELVVDLDNALSVETFVRLTERRGTLVLREPFPAIEDQCVTSSEGKYTHELIVPMVRRTPTRPRKPTPDPWSSKQRQRALGSEWLYAKLFTGESTADLLIREVLAPLHRELVASGHVSRWFFIRYGPPWHLRARYYGEPTKLIQQALPVLAEAFALANDRGLLWNVEWSTYERELERYGGPRAMELAEGWFHADSEAVFKVLEHCSGDVGLEERWRLCLVGMDRTLRDFGLSLEERLAVVQATRDGFSREFRVDRGFSKQLSTRFRKTRRSLEALLDGETEGRQVRAAGLRAFEQRSQQTRSIFQELGELTSSSAGRVARGDLVASFLHMHANRMIRDSARAHELVLYDYLTQLYRSRYARQSKVVSS